MNAGLLSALSSSFLAGSGFLCSLLFRVWLTAVLCCCVADERREGDGVRWQHEGWLGLQDDKPRMRSGRQSRTLTPKSVCYPIFVLSVFPAPPLHTALCIRVSSPHQADSPLRVLLQCAHNSGKDCVYASSQSKGASVMHNFCGRAGGVYYCCPRYLLL